MDTDRAKKASQWFYTHIFGEQPIRQRPASPAVDVPSLIRTARSLENTPGNSWQSRESVFLKQAKLLANYEDDYEFTGTVTRYYPTYESLSDQELRGYFSWRSKVRKGDIRKASLSFAFLYIYELINQIGISGPGEGYTRLRAFRDAYGKLDDGILAYLDHWLADYVVYYNLSASLLSDLPQVVFDRSITVLENIQHQEVPKVIDAVKRLSPKWLDRSRFYAENREDMDTVLVAVLRRISTHYDTRCKKGIAEQFFGPLCDFQIRLFESAVFADPLKKRNFEYALDERCVYRCKGGLWTLTKHVLGTTPSSKLGDIIKAVDAVMREAYGFGHPIKSRLETKWMLKIIHEEVKALSNQKKAEEASKITIDYSRLSKIRQDAAETQEKLLVEEEMELSETAEPTVTDVHTFAEPEPALLPADTPLDTAEYRLLQCLLYGGSLRWIQAEGLMLSVLTDSINEKLYDTFQDSVLDDTPQLIEDYIDDLKEMVLP